MAGGFRRKAYWPLRRLYFVAKGAKEGIREETERLRREA